MTNTANIIMQNNHLVLSGDLTFATVPNIWKMSLPMLSSLPELNFDLEKVHSSNSAGVALLLEWVKYAKKSHKKIHFSNLPKQLVSIMDAAGIRGIL